MKGSIYTEIEELGLVYAKTTTRRTDQSFLLSSHGLNGLDEVEDFERALTALKNLIQIG